MKIAANKKRLRAPIRKTDSGLKTLPGLFRHFLREPGREGGLGTGESVYETGGRTPNPGTKAETGSDPSRKHKPEKEPGRNPNQSSKAGNEPAAKGRGVGRAGGIGLIAVVLGTCPVKWA